MPAADANTSSSLKKIWDATFTPGSGVDTPTFHATVAAVAELGVNRYRVDFVGQTVTSYIGNEVDIYKFSQDNGAGTAKFSGNALLKAIKKAQDKSKDGRADYAEFEKETIASGVVEYTVFIQGKKVLYLSVLGDSHVETFAGVLATGKEAARRLREAVGMVDI